MTKQTKYEMSAEAEEYIKDSTELLHLYRPPITIWNLQFVLLSIVRFIHQFFLDYDYFEMAGRQICILLHMMEVDIIQAVSLERERQDTKHPMTENYPMDTWRLILLEEYGEMVKEYNDIVTNAGLSQDTNIDELKTQFQKNFVNECVQFLAVIVRYIEWGNCSITTESQEDEEE